MSVTATETERLEQPEDGLRSNVLEMMSVINERLPYFRRIAMRRLDNAADAEDAVHDAFLSAWKHLDQFRGQAGMSTWLTRIVMNSSLQMIRKRARLRLLPMDGQEEGENNAQFSELVPDCRPDPEAQFQDSEYERRLHYLTARLPPALGIIVRLRNIEGLSTRETAEALGITQSAVKSRAARARAKLQRLNQERSCRFLRAPAEESAKLMDPLRQRRRGTGRQSRSRIGFASRSQ